MTQTTPKHTWEAYEAANPIVVADELIDPHPMTRDTAVSLDVGWQLPWDKRGAVRCWGPNTFSIRVHPASFDRALRIIDALTKACETRGFQFRYHENIPYTGVCVVVDDEEIPLALNERMARMPYRPTKQELKRQQRGEYMSMPVYSYRPTGELSLAVDRYAHCSLKRAWTDHPRRKLEAQLNDVMLGLRAMAATLAAQRRDREESARRNEAFRRSRQELREEIKQERKARDALIAEAESWQRAETLRAYLATVEKLAKDEGTLDEYADWLDWAHDHADRLDPLSLSPPSVLDTPRDKYREPGMNEFLNEEGEIEEA